jgi:hypothetical protein
MRVCACACIYACVSCVYGRVYLCVCMYIVCICSCICMYICMCKRMCICMCMCGINVRIQVGVCRVCASHAWIQCLPALNTAVQSQWRESEAQWRQSSLRPCLAMWRSQLLCLPLIDVLYVSTRTGVYLRRVITSLRACEHSLFLSWMWGPYTHSVRSWCIHAYWCACVSCPCMLCVCATVCVCVSSYCRCRCHTHFDKGSTGPCQRRLLKVSSRVCSTYICYVVQQCSYRLHMQHFCHGNDCFLLFHFDQ